MLKWIKNLFHHECEHECEHDWKMEEPTMNFGNSFKMWEGPIYDYCTKCGERRPHPECRHIWLLAPEKGEINGVYVNGKRIVKTAICGKCGAAKWETVE